MHLSWRYQLRIRRNKKRKGAVVTSFFHYSEMSSGPDVLISFISTLTLVSLTEMVNSAGWRTPSKYPLS
jgi:hypothetical protein